MRCAALAVSACCIRNDSQLLGRPSLAKAIYFRTQLETWSWGFTIYWPKQVGPAALLSIKTLRGADRVTQLFFFLSVLFYVRDLAEGQRDQIEGLFRRLGGEWIHNVRCHLSTRLDLVDVVRRSTSKSIYVIPIVATE